MSIIRNFARLGRFVLGERWFRIDDPHCTSKKVRACKFEQLEIRNPLTASPAAIHLGSVYLEQASGDDSIPNLIKVQFQGGAPGTQLTQIVIDGDKDHNGAYSSGEIFFDTAAGGLGDFKSNPFQFDAQNSTGGAQVTGFTVVDGGQKLIINISGMDAGDTLAFTIDVDEVQFVDAQSGDVDTNSVVEGNEFQRSIMTGTFVAPHYFDATGSALYWDAFDQNFAAVNQSSGTTLTLPSDSYVPPSTKDLTDLTAGAVLQLQQIPLPSSISGTVYHDKNLDNLLDNGEQGIGNVALTLLQWDGSQWASTGKTTTTDANGNYKFDNLLPGTYRVAETQPNGWFSVGSQPGTVDGVVDGTSTDVDTLSNAVLLGGQDGIHYNFGECLPASIAGRVWYDPQGDCVYGPNDVPLSGVTIDLLNSQGTVIATTTTNALGQYEFDGIAPGTYGVKEHQPQGYLEGCTMAGSEGGDDSVTDVITQVTLGSSVHAINYDFSELLPGSISGYVHADPEGDCIVGPNDIMLAGVKIDLLDSEGNVLRSTFTDENGYYEFTNLAPGTYGVFEHQPAGYFSDGGDVGSLGGVVVGDLITQVKINPDDHGTHYDFCEHMPNSISGTVHLDPEGDCVIGPHDIMLSGVQVDLLNSDGQVIATTFTNNDGYYEFTGLDAGTYSVKYHPLSQYFDDGGDVGSLGGAGDETDTLSGITLLSDDHGTDYNFCEHPPSSIEGSVHLDPEGDCVIGPHDIMLAGVQVDLLDSEGTVIATTHTDENGHYKFDDLDQGTYSVHYHPLPQYFDDGGDVGSLGGVGDETDTLSEIVVGVGVHGVDYNFCEHPPASISGSVHLDPEGDCEIGPHDIMLAGVKVDLLNSDGQVIATTTTDVNGLYKFDGLDQGTYSVRYQSLPQYIDDGGDVGSNGGSGDGTDVLSDIELGVGDQAVDYNFCEHPPSSLSGYVFQDGGPIILLPGQKLPDIDTIRDGVRRPGDNPIAGVTLLLYDGQGNPVLDGQGHQLTAVTDANGFYKFSGLRDGTYVVREFQPSGYIDGIDTPGSTGGIAQNHNTGVFPTLPFSTNFDVIAAINLGVGQNSVENNFSEVVTTPIRFIPPPPPPPPQTIPRLVAPAPQILPQLNPPPYVPPLFNVNKHGADAIGYTWHLSIVNAGYPRGAEQNFVAMEIIDAAAEAPPWSNLTFTTGKWKWLDADGNEVERPAIGIPGAIPLAGDFRGDGTTELGLYVDGQWFIDVNGDGIWNAGDLWARLGTRDDQAVVGDWDGDGKDDIGIYGPAWPRDPRAIAHDPGLPDPMNKLVADRHKKNVPPPEDVAALGRRKMAYHGKTKTRDELIDHVFHYGRPGDRAVVGDWTGSGLRRVAVFHDGDWYLDMDGDGRWSPGDLRCSFGQAGDLPVVGDWTGDGIEKIGVYRNGTWYLDVSNHHQLDASAKVVHLGAAGDKPVVAHVDGRAVIGVYHADASPAARTAEVPAETATK